MNKRFCPILIIISIVFFLLLPNSDAFAANSVIETPQLITKEVSKKSLITEAKLMAVGDIMMHVPHVTKCKIAVLSS